ncbi:hypothetical protein ACFP3V_10620 [Streptacidiphilus monticola]|jgi:FXSXX-COOH protein|uniref:FXSXX-COOH protein n=2 Tax=Streptacidiphilus monticola TaxID=2161674 RepID=A0ABW1FZH9_9ACTN
MGDDSGHTEAQLADLTGVDLDTLWELRDAALDASVARMLARIDNARSSFGGYNPQREG